MLDKYILIDQGYKDWREATSNTIVMPLTILFAIMTYVYDIAVVRVWY